MIAFAQDLKSKALVKLQRGLVVRPDLQGHALAVVKPRTRNDFFKKPASKAVSLKIRVNGDFHQLRLAGHKPLPGKPDYRGLVVL